MFVIPLILVLISIYFLNRLNKDKIKSQFEAITVAEGITIRNLVQVSGRHLMDEGEEELKKFLNNLYENPLIIYIGLFKENNLDHLLSRYEGYFPVMEGPQDFHIIDSPIGKIFDIKGIFKDKYEKTFKLHIGFNYEFLSTFEQAAGRNFLIISMLFALILLFITALIIYFDKKFFQKELELEREKQEKERFKELSLLTSEIAHEIKNPLNSIYLSFNALEKFLDKGEDALFYRDAVKGEIKRINQIIQSYSDLSKEIYPEIEAVHLDHFIKEFQLLMSGELEKGRAEMEILFNNKKNMVFKTDPRLLKQVLLNLVKNALEAGANRVELTIAPDKKQLTVTVKDNGSGIDKKMAANIFKPYVSTKTKGMGLGLHIVLKILKALHGSIHLVSRSPGSTLFKIQIPG